MNNKIINKKNKTGKIAIFQVSLLIISLFAFAFLIGGMERVSAANDDPVNSCTYTSDDKTYSGICTVVGDCKNSWSPSSNSAVEGCVGIYGCCYEEEISSNNQNIDNGCTDVNTGKSGYCISGVECDSYGYVRGTDSKCSPTQVCCYPPNAENNQEDSSFDINQGINYLNQYNTIKSGTDKLKGYLGDEPEKKIEDPKVKSNTEVATSAKGSSKNIGSQATGIVGTGLGKLGLSTYTKGTEYVILEGEKVLIQDLSTEQLTSSAIEGGIQAYSGFGYSLAGIIKGAAWGYALNLGISWLGAELDPDNAYLWDTIGTSVGWGVFAGQAALSLFGEGGWLAIGLGPWGAVGIGAATAIITFLALYTETDVEYVTFTCHPWAAPLGGENCELCNEQGDIPCTEYQCKSLGQACELINEEGTGEPICYWKDRNDVTPPVMTAMEDALLPDFVYSPNRAISPPERGVKVEYDNNPDGCLPAFTPVAFGVSTDEASRCKIDIRRKPDFDSMMDYMGGDSSFAFNHTQTIVLPGPNSGDNLTLRNDGQSSFFVRCQDPNGNYNVADFLFTYCVNDGPDTTPPLIVTTDLLNNGPIAYNQSSVDLTVYVNEPADCRWDKLDRDYDDMQHEMNCEDDPTKFNAKMLYECDTTLEGLISRQENKFFFRCEDQPDLEGTEQESDRNKNTESYEFILQGTQPLQIDSVKPDGEKIDGPTDKIKVTLEVETSAGYNRGESICRYKDANDPSDSYTDFFQTNSHTHSQDLYFYEGNYNYSIMCVDLGGNTDFENAVFEVETDLNSPLIVRAYYEDGYMKLITNEPAQCVYGIEDCNYPFEEGIKIQASQDVNHYVEWNTEEDLFIKCQDIYENQPLPQDTCSIVVRASKYYEAEE